MQKTIIALSGVHNSGKTTTIKKVDCLLDEDKRYRVRDMKVFNRGVDISVVVEVMNKKIGINSHGDIPSRLDKQLEKIMSYKCDIIIVATRSRGKTVKCVKKYKKKYGYEIIWIDQIKKKRSKRDRCAHNQSQAEEIVGITKKLLSGKAI